MKGWIFSIVGIVIVTVLLDLLLEEGETKKYIKGILALFAVIVIASPIPKLLKGGSVFDSLQSEQQIQVDQQYLKQLNERRLSSNIDLTKQRLVANELSVTDIEGILDASTTEYRLIKIIVRVKKSVISDEQANINKTDKIIKIVSEGLKAEKEVVSVYVEEDDG